MKTVLLTVSMACALSTGAMAADAVVEVPIASTYNWAGVYVGGDVGGGWGTSKETYFLDPNSSTFNGSQSYDTSGALVGGTIGYNWQSGPLVLGVEGNYSWSGIKGRSDEINQGDGDTYSTKLRSFGDVRARVGYATGPALFYADGGVAFGQLVHTYDAAGNGGAGNSYSSNATRTGWTAGAGMEYMFAPKWSAKIEYNYVDLGKSEIDYGGSDANRSEWKDTFHVVKVGINFHFN